MVGVVEGEMETVKVVEGVDDRLCDTLPLALPVEVSEFVGQLEGEGLCDRVAHAEVVTLPLLLLCASQPPLLETGTLAVVVGVWEGEVEMDREFVGERVVLPEKVDEGEREGVTLPLTVVVWDRVGVEETVREGVKVGVKEDEGVREMLLLPAILGVREVVGHWEWEGVGVRVGDTVREMVGVREGDLDEEPVAPLLMVGTPVPETPAP